MEGEVSEMVICAAVKCEGGRVFHGHRHGGAIFAASEAGYTGGRQGFVTGKGTFVSRREAYILAVDCGQVERREDHDSEDCVLISEDLY